MPRTRPTDLMAHPFLIVAVMFLSLSCGALHADLTGWIDRIEGDIAVVFIVSSDQTYVRRLVPISQLPPDVREGDWLRGGELDPYARSAVDERVRGLLNERR